MTLFVICLLGKIYEIYNLIFLIIYNYIIRDFSYMTTMMTMIIVIILVSDTKYTAIHNYRPASFQPHNLVSMRLIYKKIRGHGGK